MKFALPFFQDAAITPQLREALKADVGPVPGIHTERHDVSSSGEVPGWMIRSLRHTRFELRRGSDENLKVKP